MSKGLFSLRMLVIDDNAQMRSIVGAVLSAAGVRMINFAGDGRRGLEQLRALKPDICFVDFEMPVKNGLDFIEAVRRLDGPERFTPIIMLTGHSDASRLNRARDCGVDEFLCKPVTARSIVTRLNAVIQYPRPYIKAQSFFGPDRRRKAIADYRGPMRRAGDACGHIDI